MAPGLTAPPDRRLAARLTGEETPWQRTALLRPGQEVILLNFSAGGVLVESLARMNPGTRTELQLIGAVRRQVRGHIARCRVTHLEPLRYEAAFIFDERVEPETVAGSG